MTDTNNTTKTEVKNEHADYDNTDKLLEKYDNFLTMLDYRNSLYYGALFRQMFSDFSTEEEDGKLDKSIDELAKLLDKACEKLNFDLTNSSMKQLYKLFSILIQKLNSTTTLRSFDLDIYEQLLFRMYTDGEVLEILEYFDKKGVKPENIVAINDKDEVVFSNNKKYKLKPSERLDDLMSLYETLQLPNK
jgi:hypothetical protein